MLKLQVLRQKLEELQSDFMHMSTQAHSTLESQTYANLNSKKTTDSIAAADAAAGTNKRWPHRWDATETLRWFGSTFPFSDLYIRRFAELDIDAESLQNLSDAELREDLQVRSVARPLGRRQR